MGDNELRQEPQIGIEPMTARLRIGCSTTELLWLTVNRRKRQTCNLFSTCMPWRGLEPRSLSAPPPQDGVSTNFTTRAHTGPALVTATGATGLEPATSRVTVECSNQTELRPPYHTANRPQTGRHTGENCQHTAIPQIILHCSRRSIAPTGIEPVFRP